MIGKPFLGLFFLLLGVTVYILPLGLPHQAHKLSALLVVTILFWLFEILPLGITALLATAAAVVLGIADKKTAFSNFAHPIVFLFIGSFLLARAFAKYRIDRYIAEKILKTPLVRKGDFLFLTVVLLVPWFLSMWLSNTATTAMLLPIVAGMLATLKLDNREKFILLGIAYASSIGGIVTPVGTPPNLIALGFLENEGIHISFGEWVLKTLPVSFITFFLLVWLVYKRSSPIGASKIQEENLKEENLDSTQKAVLLVFSAVVFLWLLPSLLAFLKSFYPSLEELHLWLKDHLHYSVVAIIGAGMLFLIPQKGSKKPILSAEDIKKLDWDTIFLFGGGLSLGKLMLETGLVKLFALKFAPLLPSQEWLFLLLLTTVTIFLTEVSSNTATANVLVPVVSGLATQMGVGLEKAVIAVTLACSYAFMLPVATPPNAIVFGFGNIKISEMVKLGFALNLAGAFIIAIFVWLLF
ncbi:MAG TPA: SLC13/DASS family transporter [Aquifex aeolicus]|nr:SLC13/DASS family transporter [Aquificales bacterium]HIQ26265.1 SLC13/DASS family transporter [Aquifex aeolicus]